MYHLYLGLSTGISQNPLPPLSMCKRYQSGLGCRVKHPRCSERDPNNIERALRLENRPYSTIGSSLTHLYILATETRTAIELVPKVEGVYSEAPSRSKPHLDPLISLPYSPISSRCVPSIANPEMANLPCNRLLPKIYTSMTGGGSSSQISVNSYC